MPDSSDALFDIRDILMEIGTILQQIKNEIAEHNKNQLRFRSEQNARAREARF